MAHRTQQSRHHDAICVCIYVCMHRCMCVSGKHNFSIQILGNPNACTQYNMTVFDLSVLSACELYNTTSCECATRASRFKCVYINNNIVGEKDNRSRHGVIKQVGKIAVSKNKNPERERESGKGSEKERENRSKHPSPVHIGLPIFLLCIQYTYVQHTRIIISACTLRKTYLLGAWGENNRVHRVNSNAA